jgi:hypothetical protein
MMEVQCIFVRGHSKEGKADARKTCQLKKEVPDDGMVRHPVFKALSASPQVF